MNRNDKYYNIDVTLTDNCNFRCGYCFETDYFKKNYFKDYDLLINKIKQLLKSNFFKKKYNGIGIGFWGGEPTLHPEAIKTIVKEFENDDRLHFLIYSNGSNVDSVIDLLEQHKGTMVRNAHPKVTIQMSYDGMPVHDIFRKTRDGKITSSLVRNNILLLDKKNIPTCIKSTITPDTLKYLKETYLDLRDVYLSFTTSSKFKATSYFPTIDYYHLEKYTHNDLEQYKKDLEEVLIKIAAEEAKALKKYNRIFFSWFTPNRAICNAGKDMCCVNWNSNIFKCHGSLYEDKSGDHFVCNLEDDNFVEKLEECHFFHQQNFAFEPEECKKCNTTYCLRCNPVKYEKSKKTSYIEKWRDYTTQPSLCELYRIIGKVAKAFKQLK